MGQTSLCADLPTLQRPGAKMSLPTYYKKKLPQPIYSLFPHTRYPPMAFSPGFQNEKEAVKARVLKQTPIVDAGLMRTFTRFVQDNYHVLFPGFRKRHPWNLKDYLKNSNASPAVKKTIEKAAVKLQEQGITSSTSLSKPELYKYTMRKAFVKVELNLYDTPRGRAEKAPRLIQGATPEFVALVGPTFAPIQKEICRVWSDKFSCFFTSGATTERVSKYLLAPQGWLWFENDVGAFDASVSYELGLLEIWLARKMGASATVCDLMRENLNTHGYTSSGIFYKVLGTRKSGDPYTSCFNSVLNGLMHLFCLSRRVSLRTCLKLVRMVVQGDDNLMRFHPSLTPDWTLLIRLGFKCDNIYRSGPEDAEFCSSKFYPTLDGYCLGPKVGRVLNKIGWFILPPLNVHPLSLVKGVAMGFQAVGVLVPTLGVLLANILRITIGHKAYFLKEQEWKMTYSVCVSHRVKYEYMMWYWYGLNTAMLDFVEGLLRSCVVGSDCTDPYLDLMFDKETIGPKLIFE